MFRIKLKASSNLKYEFQRQVKTLNALDFWRQRAGDSRIAKPGTHWSYCREKR